MLRMSKRLRWGIGAGLAGLLAAALVLGGVLVGVEASHNFTDVATGAFYHSAVEWVVNRAITAGCAVGLYCPDAAVTRGQMAVFLRTLGNALTPTLIKVVAFEGAQDPDASPTVCQTTSDFTVTGYARTAQLFARAVAETTGAANIRGFTVFSSDGGVTWIATDSIVDWDTADAAGARIAIRYYGDVDLAVGSLYRFGIRLDRGTGTGDLSFVSCELFVQIINRNPATSPLMPSTPIIPGPATTPQH